MRQFYRYLVSENMCVKTIQQQQLKARNKAVHLPKTLSEEEVSQLIKTAGQGGGADSIRLGSTCLKCFMRQVLRVSELVGLANGSHR